MSTLKQDRDRLLSKVRETSTGCWEWQASRAKKGYGYFWLRGDVMQAHRASYVIFCGPIPEGMVVRHRCDNPPCVNPDHLEVGTVAENNRDMAKRGRSTSFKNQTWGGLCKQGRHTIASPSDQVPSSGACRKCQAERSKRWALENPERRRASKRAYYARQASLKGADRA